MAATDDETTVAERLGRLLDRGLLPAGGPAEAAERLIDRLRRPARVGLLGLPGAGKSAVLNLLAGTVVVPETLRLPTMIVQHGAEPRMLCTLADSKVVTVPGNDLEKALTLSPALITLELDIPALKVISLLEVAAGSMEAEQRRAALWAGKRADILIWCTTAYLPKEQLVWEGMPDSYKDNGFLLVTKVDLLGGREAAAGMHARIEQRAAGEFRQVLPISAKLARAAAPEDRPFDRERFQESGAAAVIATIKSRVRTARQADKDTAELILARHPEPAETVARPKVQLKAVETPTPEALSPEAVAAEAAALERVFAAAAEVMATRNTVSDPSPDFAQTAEPSLDPFPEPEREAVEEEHAEGGQGGPTEPETVELPPDPVEESALAAAIAVAISGVSKSESEQPGAAPIVEHQPEPEPAPEVQPESGEGAQRFAARLREITATADPAQTEMIPLRATWKSRSDSAISIPTEPKPEPNRNPTPRQRPIEPGGGTQSNGRVLIQDSQKEGFQEPPSPEAAPVSEINPPESDTPEPSTAPSEPSATDFRGSQSTSVFGVRQRPESATEVPHEALPEQPPQASAADESLSSEALQPEPMTAMLTPETPSPTPLEAGERRPGLSERLGRPAVPAATEVRDTPEVHRIPRQFSAALSYGSPRPVTVHDQRVDSRAAERRERPRISRRVVEAEPPQKPAPAELPETERVLVDRAIDLIVSRTVDLSDQIDPEEKAPVDMILDHARETVDQVLTLFSYGSSTGIRRISTNIGEVHDLITLMQLEKGHAPADDALTLLLQLRRELEALRII